MQTGIYEHYKGMKYEVIDTLRHSETEELMVLYRALYGDEGYGLDHSQCFSKMLL